MAPPHRPAAPETVVEAAPAPLWAPPPGPAQWAPPPGPAQWAPPPGPADGPAPAYWPGSPPGSAPPGPPPRPPRRTSPLLVAALVVLVVGAVAGGAVYLFRPSLLVGAAGAPQATGAPQAGAPLPADTPSAGPRPRPVPSPAPASADDSLDALVTADRPVAESLVGRWVPQLASKQVGTVDKGTTYDEAAILGEVQALKQRFPQAVVVRSDEFTSFRRAGFWVTLVAVPSSTADGANSWCATNGFAPGDCFAKRLSHTEGPQGNTVPR